MVDGGHENTALADELSMLTGDAVILPNQAHGSDSSKTHENLWLDQLDLLLQIANASILLRLERITVLGRTALDNIGDIAILTAIKVDDTEHIIKELSGSAHKRLTLQVLLLSRTFANEQNIRLRIAHTEHHIMPCGTKGTASAVHTALLKF